MSTLEVIFLGIIQGLTEFLPVSSSGHLVLFEHLFGLTDLEQYIFFNVTCHLGTLLAILCVFKREILIILKQDWNKILQVMIGTAPLFLVAFLIKPIKSLFDIHFIGYFFFLTALFLYLGMRFGVPDNKAKSKTTSWKDPLIIGLFQAIAVLPGISRSGTTISIARILRWHHSEAILFSFLLAIPAILGASAFELLGFFINAKSVAPLALSQYLWAFATSFGVGYFALRLLIKLASKDRFMYFVIYCIAIGVISITLSLR